MFKMNFVVNSKNGKTPPNLSGDKVPDHGKNHVFHYFSDKTTPELGGGGGGNQWIFEVTS